MKSRYFRPAHSNQVNFFMSTLKPSNFLSTRSSSGRTETYSQFRPPAFGFRMDNPSVLYTAQWLYTYYCGSNTGTSYASKFVGRTSIRRVWRSTLGAEKSFINPGYYQLKLSNWAVPLTFVAIRELSQKTVPGGAPRGPSCPKFSSDALSMCPQPLPSTHTCLSVLEHVVGADGTAVHEGS